MSREELISYIDELKKQRAFTEEDRYLLKILDNSPFTIWASDRDCKIRFWGGQCEALYGYPKSAAIGRDFVDLFVAPDEQKAAREDQIKIIDNSEVFHNIANDHAKTGNTLRLLTNCWRMKSPNSDEYWNVEMGLIVDFFDQEMERLEEIISESRLYKARVTQFVELTKQIRRQFSERKKNFNNAVRECRRLAVRAKKSTEFRKDADKLNNRISEIDEQLTTLIDEYLQKVQASGSSSQCEELTDKFKEKYDELLDNFDDGVLDLEEISIRYTPDGIVSGKDTVLRETAVKHERLYSVAFELKLEINKRIDRIKAQITKNEESQIFQYYAELLERVEAIISRLQSIQETVYKDIGLVRNYNDVMQTRNTMNNQYSEIETLLEAVNADFKRGPH